MELFSIRSTSEFVHLVNPILGKVESLWVHWESDAVKHSFIRKRSDRILVQSSTLRGIGFNLPAHVQ